MISTWEARLPKNLEPVSRATARSVRRIMAACEAIDVQEAAAAAHAATVVRELEALPAGQGGGRSDGPTRGGPDGDDREGLCPHCGTPLNPEGYCYSAFCWADAPYLQPRKDSDK